jgi:hypothetical protein
VCVPVDAREVDHFDPSAVPTVGKLLRELDRPSPDSNSTVPQDAARKVEPGSSFVLDRVSRP